MDLSLSAAKYSEMLSINHLAKHMVSAVFTLLGAHTRGKKSPSQGGAYQSGGRGRVI
jgi:hypothetical protein